MTDSYIDELAAIRREQSSNLPAELTADPTFMAMRTVAQFGTTEAGREMLDALLALAFSHGRIDGGNRLAAALTAAASPSNVVRIK